MSKIRLTPNASGTGTVTLTVPSTSTDRTVTLPDETGTVITTESTQSKVPILRLPTPSNIGTQALASSSFSSYTIQWNASHSDFIDTHSFWNSSTNVYTPTIAGYYMITYALGIGYGSNVTDRVLATISFNDSFGTGAQNWDGGNNFTVMQSYSNYIFYCNGSSDNIRFKGYANGSSRLISQAFATIHYLRS